MPATATKPIAPSPAPPSPNPLRSSHRTERAGDRFFRFTVLGFGLVVIALTVAMGWQLAKSSSGIWKSSGLSFLWGQTWDPVEDVYGCLPFIFGTLVSSALALLIAVPLGVGSAVFLAEMAPKRIAGPVAFCIELLAAVPSVILGLMGIFVLVPGMRAVEPFLIKSLGFLPFFRGYPYGVGLLTAGILLAFMTIPYITSISRDVILAVPRPLKEAALGLGATHWEMVRMVILPYARAGILGSIFLALGRALGETMAVTMVIGNNPKISWSLLDPGYTMASVIANEFAEATSDAYVRALMAVALVLFGITFVVNGIARLMIYKTGFKRSGRP